MLSPLCVSIIRRLCTTDAFASITCHHRLSRRRCRGANCVFATAFTRRVQVFVSCLLYGVDGDVVEMMRVGGRVVSNWGQHARRRPSGRRHSGQRTAAPYGSQQTRVSNEHNNRQMPLTTVAPRPCPHRQCMESSRAAAAASLAHSVRVTANISD